MSPREAGASAPGPAGGGAAPDVHAASAGYARRFAGPAGRWFLRVQDGATRAVIAGLPPGTALDVGGGHGQNLAVLAAAGHAVTVLGSEPVCGARLPAGTTFAVGGLTDLPYPAGAFDLVLSYRLLAHLPAWRRHLAELCRVSRRAVVVEFPVVVGCHALAGLLFAAKQGIEGDTRPYARFREVEVAAELRRHRFRPVRRQAQHFWPMALHRLHGSATLGAGLEWGPRRLGLCARLGSPVIARFDREE